MDHYELQLDESCRLFVARRTAVAFADVAAIVRCFATIEGTLSKLTRANYALLVDVRNGPARNDPAFESAIAAHRGKLLLGFGRNAALVATAVGRLQVQRYANRDGRDVFATDNEQEAFRYLGLPNHELG